MFKGIKINSIISAVCCTALMIFIPSSCSIDEDLPPCPRGLDLHFVFDYHLEGWSPDAPEASLQELPNVFNPQVHCYTLNVYDEEGQLIRQYHESGDNIRSNHYRLQIDLPHGKYHIRAFGGTACDRHSFSPMLAVGEQLQPMSPDEPHRMDQLRMQMDYDRNRMTSDRLLHDYYYAYALDGQPMADAEVVVDGEMYREHTLRFMRNTNSIRVLMHQAMTVTDENGNPYEKFFPVNPDDYLIRVIDCNTLFDYNNRPVLTGDPARDNVTYYPWTTGTVTASVQAASQEEQPITASADISVSRLMAGTQGRLEILNRASGELLMSMPLNYLQFSKPAELKNMSVQEYLDRQKYWNVTFIRHSNELWADATIIINGWTVRLEDIEF